MKKTRTLFLLFTLYSFVVIAQKTTIDLEKFSELKVFDRVEVTLVKSSENKAFTFGL